jgi:hypothetical protein
MNDIGSTKKNPGRWQRGSIDESMLEITYTYRLIETSMCLSLLKTISLHTLGPSEVDACKEQSLVLETTKKHVVT